MKNLIKIIVIFTFLCIVSITFTLMRGVHWGTAQFADSFANSLVLGISFTVSVLILLSMLDINIFED